MSVKYNGPWIHVLIFWLILLIFGFVIAGIEKRWLPDNAETQLSARKQKLLSAKLRDDRYPNSNRALIYSFPIKMGSVRITHDWFIMRESSDPAVSKDRWFRDVCRNITWVMGCLFAGIFVFIDIMTGSFGRGWWIYLLIIALTFVSAHFEIYYYLKWGGHLRIGASQGNANIASSSIEKVSFLNEFMPLWPSRVLFHYKDDKGRRKLLALVVEGSFYANSSQAAKASVVLLTQCHINLNNKK